MKFNVLRSVAATLSLGVCTFASAQYGAPAPYGSPYGQPQPNAQFGTPNDFRGVPATQSVRTFNGPTAQGNQPGFQGPNFQQQTYQPPAYQAPAKWNNFGVANRGPALFQPAAADLGGFNPEQIPTPPPAGASFGNNGVASPSDQGGYAPTPAPQYSNQQAYPAPQGHYEAPAIQNYSAPAQHVHNNAGPNGSCSSCNQSSSAFITAAQQPWDGGYGDMSGQSCNGPACGVPMAGPVRAPLFPWFGSFDLLFFNLDTNGKDRGLVSGVSGDPTRPYVPVLNSSAIDPDSALGYSLSFGRYLGCGQFGLGVTYFNFNPDVESVSIFAPTPLVPNAPPNPGDFRTVGMPQYRGAQMAYMHDNGAGGYSQYYAPPADGIGNGNGQYTVYHIIDGQAGQHADDNLFGGGTAAGSANTGGAQRIRADRDVDFQGLELNLFSFGLMGAQRASAMNCGGGGCGAGAGAGFRNFMGFGGGYGGVGGYGGGYSYGGHGSCNTGQCQPCGPRFGFGGAGGPLVRPCNGKVQVMTSHGIRWFQFQDTVNFAYDVDGRAGYGDNDLYDDTRVENNLFGYQFGSQLIYCLGSRVNLFLGGKFGVYGNEVEQQHRLGSRLTAANLAAMPDLAIDYDSSDTFLSTLGEIDLGLGYRVSNAWTIRGGYRVMGVTGVASADGFERDYSSAANAMAIHADESLLLHGAYVGSMFNW